MNLPISFKHVIVSLFMSKNDWFQLLTLFRFLIESFSFPEKGEMGKWPLKLRVLS